MRVALISDLHGNEAALDAVLASLASQSVDRIVCLGDVATLGPRPREVLSRIAALGCPCIMGNHDAFMLDADLIRSYTETPIVVQAVDWCRERMTPSDLAFIRTFVPTLEIDLDATNKLFLFHGTPRSNMEDIVATATAASLDDMLGGRRATVLAGGHTHVQMLRVHRGMMLVNPGSLGAPFKDYLAGAPPTILPHAEYAIVSASNGEVDVSLRRVPIDLGRMREHVAGVDHPMRDLWTEIYA